MLVKRKIHTAAFKAKLALEAIKGEKTLNEIAQLHEVHPVQVAQWRKVVMEGASRLFERGAGAGDRDRQKQEDALLHEVGRLQVEVSFLKKKWEKFQ